jgi:hypothetical protein
MAVSEVDTAIFVYIAATRNSEPLSCVLPPLVDGI